EAPMLRGEQLLAGRLVYSDSGRSVPHRVSAALAGDTRSAGLTGFVVAVAVVVGAGAGAAPTLSSARRIASRSLSLLRPWSVSWSYFICAFSDGTSIVPRYSWQNSLATRWITGR